MSDTKWAGTCIKLTDEKGRTRGGCQWGRGIVNPNGVRSGQGGLCSPGFYHAYDLSPAVPLFLNPQHANFKPAQVWLAEWRGARKDDSAMKMGATELRTVRLLKVEEPTTLQRVAFAIFVADATLELVGQSIPAWTAWAESWQGETGAANAAAAAYAAANAAHAADYAAYAADYAAAAAAKAAYANANANAAHAADYAAYAADYAAHAAAYAAYAAAERMAIIFENAAAWALSRQWTTNEFDR